MNPNFISLWFDPTGLNPTIYRTRVSTLTITPQM